MGYKAKVLLFNPNPRGFEGQEATFLVPPFALLAIAGPLDKEGYKVTIIDEIVEPNWRELLKKEIRKGVLCLGITSMTGYQIKGAIEASKLAKTVNPSTPIIWGGYHASILPAQTLESPFIDIVVKGQGEQTLLELVEVLHKKKSITQIAGIYYKQQGKVVATKPRPFEDINKFPRIPFHLINPEKYIFCGITPKTIGYITSQGCPFSCNFCAEMQVTERSWSGSKPKRIIEDIAYLKKRYGIEGFHIFDSNFFVDKKRVREFCQQLIKKKLAIKWGNVNIRVDALKNEKDIYDLMAKSGCSWVLTGAESGRQETLDLVNKGVKVEDLLEFKNDLSKYSIRPFMSFILGLPSSNSTKEVKQEFNATLAFIKKIMEIDDLNTIVYWLYTPYPGTRLYEKALTYGFNAPKSLEGWANFNFSSTNLPWISKKYARRLDVLNKFIFPYTSHYFKKEYQQQKKSFLKKFLAPYHQFLCLAASIRWNYQFFAFPVEYYLIRLQQRIRH